LTYRLRPGAQNDLESIWLYTAQRWSAEQAERYVGEIRRTIERLASGEIKGRIADIFRRGYLRQASGSHMIYYNLSEPTSKSRVFFINA
jgi:toxin ParE1/3/4